MLNICLSVEAQGVLVICSRQTRSVILKLGAAPSLRGFQELPGVGGGGGGGGKYSFFFFFFFF